MAQALMGALMLLACLSARAVMDIDDDMQVDNLDVTSTLRVRGGSPAVGKLLQGIDTLGNATWWTPTYISGVAWGSITGTLSSQTDLNSALAGREPTISAGTTAQYWRGDKTWQSVASAVYALLSGTSPISFNNLTGAFSIANAAADGSTKGAASFTANDFDASSGNISLDYTNGQKATSLVPGFLSAADWGTFNGKQAAGNYITALTGDVTASGPGSVAATIANNAVTNAKFRQSLGLSVVGRSANSTGDVADIRPTFSGQVFQYDGSTIGWGSVNLSDGDAITGDLPLSNLAQGTALSVLGVTGNATADNASIVAGADGAVLRRVGTSVAFGQVPLNDADAVTGALGVTNGGTGNTNIYGTANSWTAAQNFSGGALVNNTGIADSSLTFLNHFETNAAAGNINWVDSVQPTVTGSPAAASIVTDANGRGSIGNCLTFDGSDDRVNWGNICDITTGDYSIAFWFRNTSGAGNQYVIDKRSGSYTGYSTFITSSGQFYIELGTASGTGGTIGSTGYRDSVWRHAVFSYTRSGNCVLYINGNQDGTRSISAASAQSLSNTVGLQWGASRDNSLYFIGQLDECMIFNRALSASESRALYSQGQEFINKQNLMTLAGAQTVTGVKTFNADTLVQPGTASATAAVGGTLYFSVTPAKNVSTGATDLINTTLAVNTLKTNGDYVEVTAWGSVTNSANAKTIKVYFGSTEISSSSIAGGTAYGWLLKGQIVRKSSTTQTAYCNNHSGSITISAPTATLESGSTTVKLTGQGGASDEITQEGMIINWGSAGS